jgi:mannosylfructose-6-phosphate phosphatase
MAFMKMLVSDMDGTLLGDAPATQVFCNWWRIHGRKARLVYTSGRFIDSVAESVREHGLPIPDAIIGGVGTEILDCITDQRDLDWEHGWRVPWDRDTVINALSTFSDLKLQPEVFQSFGKVSYYLHQAVAEQLHDIHRAIADCGITPEIIYSSARDLDILPHGVNKGLAAAYLAKRWSIAPSEVVACGDSGNDLSLFRQGFRGIVVANAQEELLAAVGRDAYRATQPFAAGVVEGLSQLHSARNGAATCANS